MNQSKMNLMLETKHHQQRDVLRQLAGFFTATFGISWGLGGVAIVLFGPPAFGPKTTFKNPLFLFLFGFGPTLASVLVSSIAGGREQLRKLAKGVIDWRFAARWYGVVLLGIPLLTLSADFISATWGASGAEVFMTTGVGHILQEARKGTLSVLLLLIGEILGGPLSEEPGWRGYALPRMLEVQSATKASIVLGIIWAFWHLPLFLFGDTPQRQISLPAFWVQCVGLSILITWVFVNTGASTFGAVLIHFVSNLTMNMHGLMASWTTALVVISAALLVIATGALRTVEIPTPDTSG